MGLKLFSYVGIIAFFLLLASGVSWYENKHYPLNVLLATVKPDNFLLNSKLYISENLTERSRRNLMQAIRAINQIKDQADPVSQQYLQTGLAELKQVLDDMNSGEFSRKDLNDASIIALNSMTYYQVKSAEEYILAGKLNEARSSLTYGMLHVKNALTHAEGSKRETEIDIYSEMNTIVEDTQLSKEEITMKLRHMLDDLEDLEIAYH